jgi:Mce-associated membrane protein
MADEDDQHEESVTSKADALALIEKAEAEAAEAEALAAAARARARAAQLRREALAMAEAAEDYGDAAAAAADAEAAYEYDETDAEDYEEAGESEFADATDAEAQHPVTKRTGWRRWAPLASATATVAAIILTIGFAAASTYMVLHHHDAIQRQKREETFVDAAKQGIINMIALDFTKAKESIQAVIDNSTGQFKDEVQQQAKDLISKVEQSKTITEGTINGAAVESGNDNSAVVLVAATSRVTNSPPGKEEPPKVWRLRVTIADVGGQYKMSKVEYVQ